MHPEQENVYGIRNEYDHYTIDRHHIKVLQQKKNTQSKSFMIGSEEGSTHSRATNTLSKEQLNRAEQVKIMHNALQHISDDKLISAITYSNIEGSVLTPRDVHNARRLFGPCLACAAGRT
jgi:hypothetical protein